MVNIESEQSISKLIEALNNGQNTPENRRVALRMVTSGQTDPQETEKLNGAIVLGWRKAGEVPVSELDTVKI